MVKDPQTICQLLQDFQQQIFNKSKQNGIYVSIREYLQKKKLLTNLDLSENYINRN